MEYCLIQHQILKTNTQANVWQTEKRRRNILELKGLTTELYQLTEEIVYLREVFNSIFQIVFDDNCYH